MENYSCPSCHRDYELCRRYVIREDDMEFAVTPRLLKCLHTCCTSCLEEMVQNNSRITCPLCKDSSVVKGVRYLPFDGCAMLAAVRADVTTMMSYCSRCHDEVPAFSWCVTCSSALCEFHHNDHKRSVDTNMHRMYTLADIASEHIPIAPHLPPVPCPDAFGEECSIYCHSCAHPVSATAMIQYHKTHRYDDIPSFKPVAMTEMSHCMRNLHAMKGNLKEAVDNIKNTMRRLDKAVDATATEIVEEIEACRAALAERENKLLQRLESVANEKRLLLTNQLNEVSDVYEECKATESCGSQVMQHLPQEQGGVYMMSTKSLLQVKYDELNKAVDTLVLPPVTNPKIACSFSAVDKEILHNVVDTLGALYIKDFNDMHTIVYNEIDKAVKTNSNDTAASASSESKESGGKAQEKSSSSSSPSSADGKLESKEGSREADSAAATTSTTVAAEAVDAKNNAQGAELAVDMAKDPTEEPATGTVSSAQFSVRMSPNVSVENVRKKEIRSIRTSVVEIRAASVPGTKKSAAEAVGGNVVKSSSETSLPMPTPPSSAPDPAVASAAATSASATAVKGTDGSGAVGSVGGAQGMPAAPHPHLTVSAKAPADDQTCPFPSSSDGGSGQEHGKRVWRKEPKIVAAIAQAQDVNATPMAKRTPRTPAPGDADEGEYDSMDEEEDDNNFRKDMMSLHKTGKQMQMLRQRKFVESVSTGHEGGISRRFNGQVIGRVVIVNEAAQSALIKHELRTLFESFTFDEDGLPVLRITNEIVSKR